MLFLPRARADGKEEIDCEKVYGPLGSIKLPYDPPRSIMPGAESRECGKDFTNSFNSHLLVKRATSVMSGGSSRLMVSWVILSTYKLLVERLLHRVLF